MSLTIAALYVTSSWAESGSGGPYATQQNSVNQINTDISALEPVLAVNRSHRIMKKGIFQLILLLSLACFCAVGFFLGKYLVQLPFRTSNDTLHKEGAPFTLDFLIPGGVYIDEKATIGDVIRMKLKQTGSPLDKFLRTVSRQIPCRYRVVGDILLFFFWTLCFLSFLRVFTFMGYGRALRISLLFGGIVYYFMPDLSPGSGDDILFILFPVVIILVRAYLVQRKRNGKKIFRKE